MGGLVLAGAPASAKASDGGQIDALLIGGDYFNGSRCVIGYNAYNAAGDRFVITSGCTSNGLPGPVPAPPDSTSTAYIRAGGGLLTVSPVLATAPIGATVCMSGPVGGLRCGYVQAMNVTISYPGGVITGLTRTSVCAYPGETGSPFFWPNGGRIIAQGVLVSASGSCSTGGVSYFKPILPILSAHSLTLFTGTF